MKFEDLKILWINDFDSKAVPFGGAELTDAAILNAAKKKNLNVIFKKANQIIPKILEPYDLIILSNNYELPFNTREFIINNKKYICLCQDYGRWRKILDCDTRLFSNAFLTIFMSPGHRELFNLFIPKAITLCIPPYINKNFCDYGRERNNRIMYVGYMHECKGIWNVLNYATHNPTKSIDFYYYGHKKELINAIKKQPNCYLKGSFTNELMPDLYNQYSYVILLPDVYESFSRVIAEAILCGCKLIINQKLGITSYKWTSEELRKATLNSHFQFWEEVEKRLNTIY